MDWFIVLLFLVLWGIVMKAQEPKDNSEPELYMQVLGIIGLLLVLPYIVYLLLGGGKNKQ
ncbi:MAG: hypothetical protein FWE64_04105 [Alphaproteobacteria bacterium]|nr:hypothetical protein [Alphaproteobacteria bacterium]